MSAVLAVADTDARKAETARPIAVAAGVTAGVGVGVGFAVAARTMWQERCLVRQLRDEAATADALGASGDHGGGPVLDLECWAANGVIFSAPIAALSVSTVVLSAVAGDRFGIGDRLANRRIPRRRALAFTLGGVGARIAGAALIVGGAVIATSHSCTASADGAHLPCMRARSYGAAALIGVGALARWSGTGLLAFGSRHLRDGTTRAAMTLSPSLLGVSGRF